MVEFYPIVEHGYITGFIASHCDFTCTVTDSDFTRLHVFAWFGDFAVDVTDVFQECGGVARFSGYVLDIGQWFENIVIAPFYVVEDLDEYVKFLASIVGAKIRDKSIVLSFSGGKDSTAALIVLSKLQEYVPFKLHVCYTYLPYLENVKTLDYVSEVSNKLGVHIEVLSPPRNIVRKYLAKEGLPYRRARWCTYLKVRPLRDYAKKNNIELRVVGDRLTECEKRWKKLLEAAVKQEFLKGKEFRPTYVLTLLDVVKICREHELIHPLYLRGLSRVSCVFCPYKTLYELKLETIDEVEDPGFIETILRRSWLKWYYDTVSYEDFTELHLWRYVPNVAKMFVEFRKFIKKKTGIKDKLPKEEVSKKYRTIWTEPLPKLQKINIEDIVRNIKRINLKTDIFEKEKSTLLIQ